MKILPLVLQFAGMNFAEQECRLQFHGTYFFFPGQTSVLLLLSLECPLAEAKGYCI